MENQWHYNRDGQQQGPISDSELRKLANDGTLKTEDLIWKDGMAEWRKAGSMKGLFQKSTPSMPPPLPPNPNAPTKPEPIPSSPEKKSGASFGASAKLARQLTAKQTELTKIQQVSLPGQYAVIGSQAFERGTQRQEHASLFEEIERLKNTIGELEKSGEKQPEAKTFADKAIALGGKAVTTTKLKAAQLQLRQKFVHLGKLIFESGQTLSESQQQKAEIERLLAREAEIQSDMGRIKGTLAEHGREAAASGRSSISSAAASGRSFLSSTAVVASLAVFCAPIGLLLIWRHPTWSKQTKLKWAGVSVGCFFVLGLFGKMQQTAALKELAAANQLWDDGDKNDAIDEYRRLIDKSSLPSSEKPQLYRRVIEFDCENDDLESARDLIKQSHRHGIKLTLTNQKAKQLQDDFEQELAEAASIKTRENAEAGGNISLANGRPSKRALVAHLTDSEGFEFVTEDEGMKGTRLDNLFDGLLNEPFVVHMASREIYSNKDHPINVILAESERDNRILAGLVVAVVNDNDEFDSVLFKQALGVVDDLVPEGDFYELTNRGLPKLIAGGKVALNIGKVEIATLMMQETGKSELRIRFLIKD